MSWSARSLLALTLALFASLAGRPSRARAQPNADAETRPGEVLREEPDPTRLSVTRLPPEAAQLSRDLYERGLFVEAALGAVGFVGDAGDVLTPAPRLTLGVGYELATWASLFLQGEAAFANTKNREPPARTAVEILGATLGLRLGVPFNAQAMLWAAGHGGILHTGGDVLRALGFRDAFKVGLQAGGDLGFDWHIVSPHHAIGVLAGARLLPSLTRDGTSLGIHGAVYLHYTF